MNFDLHFQKLKLIKIESFVMSSLYPTLDCNLPSDRVSTPEIDDIEIVIQIPPENITIHIVHSDSQG